MERSSAASPARTTGGMCDRFLTFLSNGLSMNRPPKSVTEGPARTGGGEGGDYHQLEKQEEDEFAIRIERAEFELNDHGDDGGHGGVTTTVLEDSSSAAAATARDDEKQRKRAADDVAAADPPAAEEETKVRKTVTIKEDRPEDAGGGGGGNKERKKSSLFSKKRQPASTSSSAGAEEHGDARTPRRSGLRPRMPALPRVPSNINEKSSNFIAERRRSFGGAGKHMADK